MPTRRRNPRAPSQASAAEALVVVAAVPLRKATKASLRLTCKATMLAVDQCIKKRVLSVPCQGLQPPRAGRPLTMGLTSVEISLSYNWGEVMNASRIAVQNRRIIEILKLPDYERKAGELLFMLGCTTWPRLRHLEVSAVPSVFTEYIKIDHMPQLTTLKLSGSISCLDLTALSQGRHFLSTVKVLDFGHLKFSEGDAGAVLTSLLSAMSRLETLDLQISEVLGPTNVTDLNFLGTTELPMLTNLSLRGVPLNFSLAPITAKNRPRLEALSLSAADGACTTDLLPFPPGSLPALTMLEFKNFNIDDWSFIRDLEHETLETLELETCSIAPAGVEHIAAALAHLPALENLCLSLPDGIEDFDAVAMTEALLSGPVHPCLRRLVTYEGWQDTSDSIKRLAQLAYKLPALEDLCLWGASISAAGFEALADAGRQGQWPRLELFEIHRITGGLYGASQDLVEEFCCSLLHEVWPDLEVDIRGG